jgi:hypothetical protein
MSESESDVVLAATDRPLPISVRRIVDERVPADLVGLATYLDDRLIARCAVPEEVVEFIEGKRLFEQPAQLVLAAKEEPPGLQCRLFALVEVAPDGEDETSEPWAASVPSYEESAAGEPGEATPQGMIFLGLIVRFAKDRKHPDSLGLEAADILRRVVEGQATEVIDKVLDDLLGGGPVP